MLVTSENCAGIKKNTHVGTHMMYNAEQLFDRQTVCDVCESTTSCEAFSSILSLSHTHTYRVVERVCGRGYSNRVHDVTWTTTQVVEQ